MRRGAGRRRRPVFPLQCRRGHLIERLFGNRQKGRTEANFGANITVTGDGVIEAKGLILSDTATITGTLNHDDALACYQRRHGRKHTIRGADESGRDEHRRRCFRQRRRARP